MHGQGATHAHGAEENRGRKKVLKRMHVRQLDLARRRLIKAADSKRRVTYQNVIEEADLDVEVSERAAADALRAIGVRFRKPREKSLLTSGDKKKRVKKGKAWMKKPAHFWPTCTYIDNKKFVVPVTEAQRKQLLQSKCTGHLRKPSEGTEEGFVKPKTKHTFISKSVEITAAVTSTKVIMWHVHDKRWCGNVAAEMYSQALLPALQQHWGKKKKFLLVEDGDRAGYQTKVAQAAKQKAGIVPMVLPPRTPQWNPLDFAVWEAIEEQALQACKPRESKKVYLGRLQRAAKSLKKAFLTNCVGAVHRRIRDTVQAKGGHIKHD